MSYYVDFWSHNWFIQFFFNTYQYLQKKESYLKNWGLQEGRKAGLWLTYLVVTWEKVAGWLFGRLQMCCCRLRPEKLCRLTNISSWQRGQVPHWPATHTPTHPLCWDRTICNSLLTNPDFSGYTIFVTAIKKFQKKIPNKIQYLLINWRPTRTDFLIKHLTTLSYCTGNQYRAAGLLSCFSN